jgi:hypothetical protein
MVDGTARDISIKRCDAAVPRPAHHHTGLRRELHVYPASTLLLGASPRLVDIESGKRAVIGKGLWFPLEFVVGKEVNAIPSDWASKRPAKLLVRIGKHSL